MCDYPINEAVKGYDGNGHEIVKRGYVNLLR